MSKSKLDRALDLEEKMKEMNNERKLLLQQHREEELKKRDRRIRKNGALLESVQPEVINLSDAELKWLLEKCLTTSFTQDRFKDIQRKRDATVKPVVEKPTPAKAAPVADAKSTGVTDDADEDEYEDGYDEEYGEA